MGRGGRPGSRSSPPRARFEAPAVAFLTEPDAPSGHARAIASAAWPRHIHRRSPARTRSPRMTRRAAHAARRTKRQVPVVESRGTGGRARVGVTRLPKRPPGGPNSQQLRLPSCGSVDEAVALLKQYGGDARILAGGQSLIPAMRYRLARPAVLIDINPVADLGYIREGDGMLVLGALARDAALERVPGCTIVTRSSPRFRRLSPIRSCGRWEPSWAASATTIRPATGPSRRWPRARRSCSRAAERAS